MEPVYNNTKYMTTKKEKKEMGKGKVILSKVGSTELLPRYLYTCKRFLSPTLLSFCNSPLCISLPIPATNQTNKLGEITRTYYCFSRSAKIFSPLARADSISPTM